jgi:hypothetical protein
MNNVYRLLRVLSLYASDPTTDQMKEAINYLEYAAEGIDTLNQTQLNNDYEEFLTK